MDIIETRFFGVKANNLELRKFLRSQIQRRCCFGCQHPLELQKQNSPDEVHSR